MKNKMKLIYKKTNTLINKCNSNNWIYIILFFIVVLTGFKNIYMDSLALLLLLIIALFSNPKEILCSYVFLFFFEPVTEVAIIGGSINRILLIIGFISVIYHIIKEKVKIRKENIFITLFLTIFLGISIILNKIPRSENIVLYINIMFLVIYCNYMSSFRFFEKKKIVDDILNAIVYGVFFSIIHGLLFWNFDLEQRIGFTNWRFNGTNDPNFLAYYINLAVVVQIFKTKSKKLIDKITNPVINMFLLIGLVLSKSITGIFINTVSFIILMIIKHKERIKKYYHEKKKKIIIYSSLLLIVLGIGVFTIVKKNINEVYEDSFGNIVAKNRIADVLLSLKNGDIDRLTSQKTRDWRLFWDNFKSGNTFVKFFGNGIQPFLIFSEYWGKKVSSHNTYLDFLNCYGLIGSIIIMWYIHTKVKNNIILLSNINNKVYRYVRIILLIYGIQLSIYTNRIFLLMFLL